MADTRTTPAWQGSDRRERLPADWAQICRQVHARSKNNCEVPRESMGGRICGRRADGGVDHINPKLTVAQGLDDLANLQDTCRWHHQKKTVAEAQEAKAEKKASKKRPAEQHPGLIRQPTR